MKRIPRFVIAFALLLSFLGCATAIRMELTRPAEVNMAGAKRVAVLEGRSVGQARGPFNWRSP